MLLYMFIYYCAIYKAESILYVSNVLPLNIPVILFCIMLFDLVPICQIVGLTWIVIICRMLKRNTSLKLFVCIDSVGYCFEMACVHIDFLFS